MSENILVEIRDLLIEIVSLLKNQNQSLDHNIIGEKINSVVEEKINGVVKNISDKEMGMNNQKEMDDKKETTNQREMKKDKFTEEKLFEYLRENSIEGSCVFSMEEVVESLDENPVVVLN